MHSHLLWLSKSQFCQVCLGLTLSVTNRERAWTEDRQKKKKQQNKWIESGNKHNKSISTWLTSWSPSALCSIPMVTPSVSLLCHRAYSPPTPILWFQETTFIQFKILSMVQTILVFSPRISVETSVWWFPVSVHTVKGKLGFSTVTRFGPATQSLNWFNTW